MNGTVSVASRTIFAAVLTAMISQSILAEQRIQADHTAKYRVVINHEEQYSIWATGKEIPRGWKATGFTGSKEQSLRHIEEVWTDMRPLSKRRKLAEDIYRRQKAGK